MEDIKMMKEQVIGLIVPVSMKMLNSHHSFLKTDMVYIMFIYFCKIFIIVSIATFFSGNVYAESLEKAQEAFEAERYKEAEEILTSLAKEDNLDAIDGLMMIYSEGFVFDEGETKQVYWTKKAAELGDSNSQYQLGKKLLNEKSNLYDPDKGVRWVEASYKGGNFFAARFLAELYLEGDYVEKNINKALAIFKESALDGDILSKIILGTIYFNGSNQVGSDLKEAFRWFEMAAEMPFSLRSNSRAYAQLKLANMYYSGRGTPQNFKESLYWLFRISESVDSGENSSLKSSTEMKTEAQMLIAKIYLRGDGVSKSEKEAAHWYLRAAENGSSEAMYLLANMYEKGQGVEKNNLMAYALFSLSTSYGYEKSMAKRNALIDKINNAQINKAQDFTSSWDVGELIPELKI